MVSTALDSACGYAGLTLMPAGADVLTVDPAYVIYDLDYEKNVRTIHEYLLSLDIHPAGRFGDWQYYNMDHSILAGKRIADGRAQGVDAVATETGADVERIVADATDDAVEEASA